MDKNYTVGDLIYDAALYDGLNTSLNDLNFYKKWLPKDKEASILELCCGTGRLTIPIAKEGYNITGVDYTASMLNQAITKANKEQLSIDFVQKDIRTLNLEKKFDFIFIPFNSIHHLYKNEDFFKVLKIVKKHLQRNGVFLLDCFNPNIRYIVHGENKKETTAEYTIDDGRKIIIKQTMNYENATQINRIKWYYYIDGVFHSIQNLDMRMFFPQELDFYLESSGVNIIHNFGSFEEDDFCNDSEKQIYVLSLKN